jgi:hypothetical protein
MIVDDKQVEKDVASFEEVSSMVTDDNDNSVSIQKGPDGMDRGSFHGLSPRTNSFHGLSPRTNSFKSFSVPEGQWDMELSPQPSRSRLEASHEEDSAQTSDAENDPDEPDPVIDKAEYVREISILKLEDDDESKSGKDKNRFTPNRTSSFKSFRY